MFARSVRNIATPTARMARRTNTNQAGLPGFLYQHIWGKSTAKYVAYVAVTLIAGDYLFHNFFDGLWDAANKGVSALEDLVYNM